MPIRGNYAALRSVALSLDGFARRGKAEANRRFGAAALNTLNRQFDEGRNPDGRFWRPTRQQGKPLNKRGDFKRSWSVVATSRGLVVRTTKFWWVVHQKGKRIYPKRGQYLTFQVLRGRGGSRRRSWVRVKSVYIYKRQILPEQGRPARLWTAAMQDAGRSTVGFFFSQVF
jgi:phage gpG-like protein